MPTLVTNRFRNAVAARQWSEAQSLLEELSGEAQSVWETAASEADRKQLAAEIEDTLQWARRTVLAARAQDERKRIHLVRRSAYFPDAKPANQLTLEV